jgi:hypothetical protein
MARKGFTTVDELRGMLAVPPGTDEAVYEREGYVRALQRSQQRHLRALVRIAFEPSNDVSLGTDPGNPGMLVRSRRRPDRDGQHPCGGLGEMFDAFLSARGRRKP